MFDDRTTASEAQRDTAFRVEFIADEFGRARGRDVAYYASHALHSLHTHSRAKGEPITAAQATRIRRAIEDASPHLLALFPDRVACAMAALALAKAKALAEYWAQEKTSGAGLDRDSATNVGRHVLWLRNCCHNLALLDEIDEINAGQCNKSRRVQ